VALIGYKREAPGRLTPRYQAVVTSDDGGATWQSLGWSNESGVYDVKLASTGETCTLPRPRCLSDAIDAVAGPSPPGSTS